MSRIAVTTLIVATLCVLGLAIQSARVSADGVPKGKDDVEGKIKPAIAKISLPIGERLVYRGSLSKAGVSVDAGSATFTVTENAAGQTVITACAEAEKFGYSLATKVTSTLDESSTRPATYHYLQSGSEQREKKMSFKEDLATYIREKHCMEPNCRDRGHFILRRSLIGKDKFVHCGDRDCRIPAHRHWKNRHEHALGERHFDMLSAVYYARSLGLKPGDAPIEVPVVNDHDRWIVRAEVKEGGRIKVPAGKFPTYKLTLEPRPAAGTKPNDEFKGLFGLNGTIHIWIDKKTKRPVLVQGKFPFGPMNLQARVELDSVSQTDKPATLKSD